MQQIFSNKKAAYGFDILDKLEVGIVLEGWEVKSFKAGNIDISGAYVKFLSGELVLEGARVSSWKTGEEKPKEDQARPRKLLAKLSQIKKLQRIAQQPGFTIIPLEGYVNDRKLIKIVIALVKGKKKFEKKQKIKERDQIRQLKRELKRY